MNRQDAEKMVSALQGFIDGPPGAAIHETEPGWWDVRIASEDGQWISAHLTGAFYLPEQLTEPRAGSQPYRYGDEDRFDDEFETHWAGGA